MAFPRGLLSVAAVAVALVTTASGCSDKKLTDSSPPKKTSETPAAPSVTTIALTLNDQPVDLTGATLKCYDFEGHVSVEARDSADTDKTRFLMDYFNNSVALSVHIQGGQPDLYEYEQGKGSQTATFKRDGNAVVVTGTIGVALDDTTPPKPFSITANCAKFFATPPDSSRAR